MPSKVWLSTRGRPVDPEDATISVFDRGFLYGDSVYETMRTVRGRVVELDAHLERLRRSAAGIAFELPFSEQEIADAIAETFAAAAEPEARIRLIVTRGTGPLALDIRQAEAPVMVVIVQPLVLPSAADYERGIAVMIVDEAEGSTLPGLKTGNYLGNILALQQAQQRGADDAIMVNYEGAVAEGANSNVFMVVAGDVHTPSLATGLLAGITRQTMIRLLRERLGLRVHERTIMPDELRTAEEVFLTSSIRGLMPVVRVDGRTIGDGTRGPITARAMQAYREYLDAVGSGSATR